MRYNTVIAYILFFASGFGWLGLHRHYLGKHGTGLLWPITGGLGGIGLFYDFLSLPAQVADANARYALERRMEPLLVNVRTVSGEPPRKSDTLEKVILRTAKKNGGFVTPGSVSLEGDYTIDEARKALEKLSSQGFAEMKIRDSGVIEFFFAEFANDKGNFAL